MAAFLDRGQAEVFHSVAAPTALWQADPDDVESIHRDARDTFEALLHRATRNPDVGSVLAILGDAGSGKTHLMRAFRTRTHSQGWGYCGYMQMTTETDHYARYILNNVIDSLEQPYDPENRGRTGLARLSAALLEAVPDLTPHERDDFRNGGSEAAERVDAYADRLQAIPAFAACDLEVLRVLLFLQQNDARVRARALMWLRNQAMRDADRAWLGGVVPRSDSSDPQRTLEDLAKIINAVHQVPLVLLIDQVEDINTQADAVARFIRLMDALIAFGDRVPNAIVVLACLSDLFPRYIATLTKSKHDRLMRNPAPITLAVLRTAEEIEAMVQRRLAHLYANADVAVEATDELYPYRPEHLAPLQRLRTRDVLQHLKDHHEQCIAAQAWCEPDSAIKPLPLPVPQAQELEKLWNDFHSAYHATIPDDEPTLATTLAAAIEAVSGELPAGFRLGCTTDEGYIEVDTHQSENVLGRLLVAICNRNAKGGGLGKQIDDVAKRRGTFPLALVRTTDFPVTATSAVAKKILALLRSDGRRVVVADAAWRRMLAFAEFSKQYGQRSDFAAWQHQAKPLTSLEALQTILNLNALPKAPPQPVNPPPRPTPPPVVVPATVDEQTSPPTDPMPMDPLLFGTTDGAVKTAVTFTNNDFLAHAAFLGGSGSGKTTAALNVVEQLLARGIPAVLLDRKGDLCRYADGPSWMRSLNDPVREAARAALRAKLDVAIYTPGEPSGRPLALPIVPPGFAQLPEAERTRFAQYAAGALGSMLGFRTSDTDKNQRAILAKAIEVLASVPDASLSLPTLRTMISEQDDGLLHAIGGSVYPAKLFQSLATRLLTLQLNNSLLLEGNEALDIDALLGKGAYARPGRVRLSVVSTRFLGDAAKVDFWVSQFLIAIARWCAKAPQTNLQAVFLFDEADMYLPAGTKQPATKAPMEDLLKRARAAGISIFLATQSPGDLDYRCKENVRTWFIGRVKEPRAIEKLRPMLAAKESVVDKLGSQATGQFTLVREAGISVVRAHESLLRTEQLSEDAIAVLARQTTPPATPAPSVVS
jgi:hypothetical protein